MMARDRALSWRPFAVLFALLACAVAPAGADEPPPLNDDYPPTRAQIAAGEAYWEAREQFWASDRAASEREQSRAAYAHQSAEAAVATALAAFPEVLTTPVAAGLPLREGDRLVRFLSDHSALIARPGGRRDVLYGTLPLRALAADGEKAPVDLRLEQRDRGFAPRVSSVETSFPGSSDAAIAVGEIGLRLSGAPVAAVVSEDRVFYPNIGTDTDAVAVAHAAGAEVFYVLRSAASPTEQVIDLRLPEGASVRAGTDAAGGVEVVRDGAVIYSVAPPVAWDAHQRPVAVSFDVEGRDRLRVQVDVNKEENVFPVLVDPAVFDHQWYGWAYDHWAYTTNHANLFSQSGPGYNGYTGVIGYYNYNYPSGSRGYWYFGSQPGAYINQLYQAQVQHRPNRSQEFGGIFDPSGNGISTGFHSQSESGASHTYACGTGASCGVGQGSTSRNYGYFGLYMTGGTNNAPPSPNAQVFELRVWETDEQIPSLGGPSHSPALPGGWVNNVSLGASLSASVVSGLGMKYIDLTSTKSKNTDGRVAGISNGCPDPVLSRCSLSLGGSIPYSTDALNTGIATIVAKAGTVVGNLAPQTYSWQLKVDHDKPLTQLTGDIWTLPALAPGTHTLTVNATDGTPGAPQSGVQDIRLTIDRGPIRLVNDPRSNDAGGDSASQTETFTVDTSDTTRWVQGEYTATVTTQDRVNPSNIQVDTRTFTIVSDNGVGEQAQEIAEATVAAAQQEAACVQTQPADPDPGRGGDVCRTAGTVFDTVDGLVGVPLPGPWSDSCAATATVADGFAGSTYVRLRVQQVDEMRTWVCFRVDDPAGYFGGRIEFTGAAAGELPDVDDESLACQEAAGNAVPGDHPMQSGDIGDPQEPPHVPYLIDAFASADAAWFCLGAGDVQKRVLVPVSGHAPPTVQPLFDSPPVPSPDREEPPVGYPSGNCQRGFGGEHQEALNADVGNGSHVWLESWRASDRRAELCVRLEGGPVPVGGSVSFDATGSPGVTPVLIAGDDLEDMDACPISVFTNTQSDIEIKRTGQGVNPASVCVRVGTTVRTITAGTTGDPIPPAINWNPDPGTPIGPLP